MRSTMVTPPEAEVDDEMEYIQENVEEYDAQSYIWLWVT